MYTWFSGSSCAYSTGSSAHSFPHPFSNLVAWPSRTLCTLLPSECTAKLLQADAAAERTGSPKEKPKLKAVHRDSSGGLKETPSQRARGGVVT